MGHPAVAALFLWFAFLIFFAWSFGVFDYWQTGHWPDDGEYHPEPYYQQEPE